MFVCVHLFSFREPFPAHVNLFRLRREFMGNTGGAGKECGDMGRDPRHERQKALVVRVKHYLERLGLLQRPKVLRLFHSSAVDTKCLKADPIMRSDGWVGGVAGSVLAVEMSCRCRQKLRTQQQ